MLTIRSRCIPNLDERFLNYDQQNKSRVSPTLLTIIITFAVSRNYVCVHLYDYVCVILNNYSFYQKTSGFVVAFMSLVASVIGGILVMIIQELFPEKR